MKKNNSVYVIAEIGINHRGEVNRALQLIDAAVNAGADAIKLQTFKAAKLVHPNEPKLPYQFQNVSDAQTQFDMLKAVELDRNQHIELIEYCRNKSIGFISTPYDKESANLLVELKADAIKVASTDTTNISFLQYVSTLGLPVIYSTGISEIWEIAKAVHEAFPNFERSKLTILHCVSSYPAPLSELNLKCMEQIRQLFDCEIGFSDHSNSLLTGAYAVCAGATTIEKHITFDKNDLGPDHKASLEIEEFIRYVNYIREAETVMGDGIKRIQPSEEIVKKRLQKGLVASENITAGTVLVPELLTAMRPATGISPLFFNDVIGKVLVCAKDKHEVIRWGDLQDD
jgi:N,N'-diacetyllegionaminate synthase